jgi:hypothetical protein
MEHAGGVQGGLPFEALLEALLKARYCWKYRVMRSQRSYLEGLIDDRDDADDEYCLIRDAVDAVDVYVDCMRTSSSQCVQSLVSTSRLILTPPY